MCGRLKFQIEDAPRRVAVIGIDFRGALYVGARAIFAEIVLYKGHQETRNSFSHPILNLLYKGYQGYLRPGVAFTAPFT